MEGDCQIYNSNAKESNCQHQHPPIGTSQSLHPLSRTGINYQLLTPHQVLMSQSRSSSSTDSIVPRFNPDKLHFTPAFLLPCDQRFCKENTSFERIRFDQKIQNAQEKSIIEVASTTPQNNKKAGPPSNYCQLCKTHYIDYTQHIRLAAHRNLQTNNSANQYIQELTHIFQKRPQRRRQIAKKTEQSKKQIKGKRQGRRKMRVEEEVKRLATCSKSSNISTNMEQQLV